MSKIEGFLKRKNIVFSAQRYFIEALSYMALGLFSSLIIGTILNTIGGKLGITFFTDTIWPIAQAMTGPAIAVAVSYGLQSPPLVIFASVLTGAAGAELGGPVGAFLAAVFGSEFGKLVYKETKIDIIVTPATTIIVGVLIGKFVGPGVSSFMTGFGNMIIYATQLQPIPMGIIISILVGMALTLPISSAAIAIMLGLSGLAGGAATVGCSAQMIGFAVMSYKENGMGGLLAQGLGTSMLQMPNIIKNPRVWIPPTLTAAILGPISTYIFKMENIPIGSGMGTSGFVGQFGTITAMEAINRGGISLYLNILLLHFILPAILTLIFGRFMRKRGWIKEGDLKLDL